MTVLLTMWKIIRPDSRRVWNNPETLSRLSRYRGIIDHDRWAKYLLAKDVASQVDLEEPTDSLWEEHSRMSTEFKKYLTQVDAGETSRPPTVVNGPTFLKLKATLAQRMLAECHFCERRCGADRTQDEKGWCKLGSESRLSSAFLHMGEEAPLVPSGTIFFSSCCFGCVFCQNQDISTNPNRGRVVDEQDIAAVAESLFKDGALNINYVGGDPIPNTHTIIGSMLHQTSNVTQLWNSNLYCSSETMRLLADIIDVWLPDFKYGNNECALRLSGVKDYFDIVSRNHLIAYEHGEVIIRHLVMPNHLECCTFPILEWVAEHMPNCMVNVMGQYRPEHKVQRDRERFKDIARRLTRDELNAAYAKANDLGICWQPVS